MIEPRKWPILAISEFFLLFSEIKLQYKVKTYSVIQCHSMMIDDDDDDECQYGWIQSGGCKSGIGI